MFLMMKFLILEQGFTPERLHELSEELTEIEEKDPLTALSTFIGIELPEEEPVQGDLFENDGTPPEHPEGAVFFS